MGYRDLPGWPALSWGPAFGAHCRQKIAEQISTAIETNIKTHFFRHQLQYLCSKLFHSPDNWNSDNNTCKKEWRHFKRAALDNQK